MAVGEGIDRGCPGVALYRDGRVDEAQQLEGRMAAPYFATVAPLARGTFLARRVEGRPVVAGEAPDGGVRFSDIDGEFRGDQIEHPSRRMRGGAGPVRKGEDGVRRAIEEAKADGEEVIGTEITFDAADVRTRLDFMTRTREQRLKGYECKNGPCADLTDNQAAAFPVLQDVGGTPRGKNAKAAGLIPGKPIGPFEIVIKRYNDAKED